MAIVNMKKVTIAASMECKDTLMNVLQAEGCIEIVDLKDDGDNSQYINELESDFSQINAAYELLKKYDTRKKTLFTQKDNLSRDEYIKIKDESNWQSLCQRSRELSQFASENRSKKSRLDAEIERYTEWKALDVSSKDLDKLKRVSVFIGALPDKYRTSIVEEFKQLSDSVYTEIISQRQQDTYIFVLCMSAESDEIEEVLKKYGFSRMSLDISETPARIIEKLNSNVSMLDEEYQKIQEELKSLARDIGTLEEAHDYFFNEIERERIQKHLVNTEKAFVLQGWVPEDRCSSIEKILASLTLDFYFEVEEPEEGDEPPIELRNNALVEPFEAITSMYSLPKYSEIDPTPVLTPFYLLFFGMMMADIGYGIIMLIATTFMLKKMDLNGGSKKITKLIQYCSAPTIIFGILYGSFFGDILPIIKPLWVNPATEIMTVLYASFGLGIVQIFTGLGVKGYQLIKNGQIWDAVFDVFFWYGLLFGLIWMLLGGGDIAGIISLLFAAGLLLTQGRSNETITGKFFGGLYGLYGVSGYLGDTLSYSRLLALGLSSGLIGNSFNLLIRLLGKGPAAIIFGSIIFVFGHTFNLLIGGLGTFVHTCRLQYLEFFGKFYEGGGKAFEPLKISTKYINLSTQK